MDNSGSIDLSDPEKVCSAQGCTRDSNNSPAMAFFPFPTKPERLKLWIQKCLRLEYKDKAFPFIKKNCLLCADHFEASQFVGQFRDRLVMNAIPSSVYECDKAAENRKKTDELEKTPESRKRVADSPAETEDKIPKGKQARLVNDSDVVNGTNVALKEVLAGITKQLGLPANTKIVYSTTGQTSFEGQGGSKTRKILLIKRTDQTLTPSNRDKTKLVLKQVKGGAKSGPKSKKGAKGVNKNASANNVGDVITLADSDPDTPTSTSTANKNTIVQTSTTPTIQTLTAATNQTSSEPIEDLLLPGTDPSNENPSIENPALMTLPQALNSSTTTATTQQTTTGPRPIVRLVSTKNQEGQVNSVFKIAPVGSNASPLTESQIQQIIAATKNAVKIAPAPPKTNSNISSPIRIVMKPPPNSNSTVMTYGGKGSVLKPNGAAKKGITVQLPSMDINKTKKIQQISKTKSVFTQTLATKSNPEAMQKAIIFERVNKEQKTTISTLKRRINKLENRVIALKLAKKEKLSMLSLKSILGSVRPYLTDTAFDIFRLLMQRGEEEKGKRYTGLRYADCTKDFALCVYCCSKTAYKVCQSVFKLPSVKSIFRKSKEGPKAEKNVSENKENVLEPAVIAKDVNGEEIQIIHEEEDSEMLTQDDSDIIDLLKQTQQIDEVHHPGPSRDINFAGQDLREQAEAITLIETVAGLEIMQNH